MAACAYCGSGVGGGGVRVRLRAEHRLVDFGEMTVQPYCDRECAMADLFPTSPPEE